MFGQGICFSHDTLRVIPLVCDGEGQAGPGQGEASSGDAAGAGQPRVRHACQHRYKVCRWRECFHKHVSAEAFLHRSSRYACVSYGNVFSRSCTDIILNELFLAITGSLCRVDASRPAATHQCGSPQSPPPRSSGRIGHCTICGGRPPSLCLSPGSTRSHPE